MGQPPSPSYATTFFVIHELALRKKYNTTNLRYFKQYIDEFIGIWVPTLETSQDTALWQNFQSEMNNYHGLEWEFGPRTNIVDYFGIKIKLEEGNVSTNLFENSLSLYQYIPPLSANPPGVLTGLVLGNCHRIFSLVSCKTNQRRHFNRFYRRLIHRVYQPNDIMPLFQRASENDTKR